MKRCKKVMACAAAAIAMLSGVVAMPAQTEAAGTKVEIPTQIVYEKNDYTTYNESWGKKAPIKEGYLFGGWYEDAEGTTPVRNMEQVTEGTAAYAKFVPANLLSVKAQNASTTSRTDANDKTAVRMVSSVDSREYENVGFEIIDMESGKTLTNAPIQKVYEKLQVGKENATTEYTSKQIFGEVPNAKEQNFIVLKVNNIPEAKWNSDIYVRPYWTTYDGVKVNGLGKYVYVNDGLDGFISVPVNLHTGAQVAAGMVSVTVPAGEGYTLEYQECRPGRVFSEMTAAINGNTIKCAGNTEQGVDAPADDLYAVFRFKVRGQYSVGNGSFLNFEVNDLGFANHAENLVDMNIMKVQY